MGSLHPTKTPSSWVRWGGCFILAAFAGKEMVQSQAPGAERFGQAGKLLVLPLGWDAGMLPWRRGAFLSSHPRSQGCPLFLGRRGIQ